MGVNPALLSSPQSVVTWHKKVGKGEGGGGTYPVRAATGCPTNQKMRKEVHPCCLFAFGPAICPPGS
ncbi:hypothetical protein PBY51_022917 [Eleginops maclovinus]|uniref:Uncharacterized protein n=1 Tax=Eleginops maclovinus TaxID=56733 RepID=A0AAN7XC10_ELEMC|nr:hypothetical protein PBY51_022917 [Eleginops maclovinus]